MAGILVAYVQSDAHPLQISVHGHGHGRIRYYGLSPRSGELRSGESMFSVLVQKPGGLRITEIPEIEFTYQVDT